ncbi:universal stress protein [Rhizobacter sp. OV335]|uniref:universal stress protein n=1 Tax=Rhizobacter sp. OV335 TaxID=1500264 RepID=UPI000911D51C|nr:universal stress protein [Rhizobacter sp. OV335]SHN15220.1 Universal stress protein family protein [Rhizobacter sp. OV335]
MSQRLAPANPIRTILMLADTSPRTTARLTVARELAERHNAEVTALFAATPLRAQTDGRFGAVAGAASAIGEPDLRELARDRLLHDITGGEELSRVRWAEVVREPVLQAVVQHALCTDLLVLGQRDPAIPGHDLPAGFTESLLIESGKPALIVPGTGIAASAPECVLVAWKPSREAARAVTAALPFLVQAREVHVASWSRSAVVGAAGGLDIVGHLKAHGITPVLHQRGHEPRSIGAELTTLAAQVGAQWLVMGCYGHGRLREQVLGGATRSLMHTARLPLLMVH